MNTKYWQIIRDDSKKTFEVCGYEANVNHFTNSISGMQRAGMNVSGLTPPVTNKTSSQPITFAGYKPESGLRERLMKEYMEIMKKQFDQY